MDNQPKFTPVADITYNHAVAELEEIIRKMQSDALDMRPTHAAPPNCLPNADDALPPPTKS